MNEGDIAAPANQRVEPVGPQRLRVRCRRWLRAGFDGGTAAQPGSRIVARLVIFVILAGSLLAMLETEKSLWRDEVLAEIFRTLDWLLLVFFVLEYGLRLWAAGEVSKWKGVRGCLRWIAHPWHVFDLALIIIFLFPFLGAEVFILRLLRIGRIFMVLRLTRLTAAGQMLGSCIYDRRYELMVSMMVALLLMVVAAVGLYLVEGSIQPEAFGSVPRAVWWAMATLTTVGYGDVYPMTAPGKFLAGVFAFIGIGIIAIPTGIIAGAFANAMSRQPRSYEEPAAAQKGECR